MIQTRWNTTWTARVRREQPVDWTWFVSVRPVPGNHRVPTKRARITNFIMRGLPPK